MKSSLSLVDAVGMAVGGMVGGGIFAVLGQAATTAGNAAWLSFGLAGLLALVTGLSYARLTLSYDEGGGIFTYLERSAGRALAGTLSWFLLLGYLFTNALYAYTFGAYGGRMIGATTSWTPVIGSVIIVSLALLNLGGVRASATVEDVVVYAKVLLLIGLGGIGLTAVRPEEVLPVFETSTGSVFGAAALIFVGYEGFQLLTYDYEDIHDHKRNLPRAIWISIASVTLLYVFIAFVLTGAVSASTIRAQEETVLAEIAGPVLGRTGFVLVLVAALFSTASAINATLFATGRLARRVVEQGQLPGVLARRTLHGVPLPFLAAQVALSVTLLFTADLEQIVSFSSVVFLSVFAVVNATALFHGVFEGWGRLLPGVGTLGCPAAAGALVRRMASHGNTLRVIGAIAALLLVLRLVFWMGRTDHSQRTSGKAR